MSVILTAGRKRQKVHKKPKKKHSGTPTLLAFYPLPEELCSPVTKVWRWVLDSRPYTLAFSRDSLNVWCNGERLETQHEFEQDGAVIDFVFHNMKCRIRSLTTEGRIDHSLVVDGNNIPDEEHMQALMLKKNDSRSDVLHRPDI